MRTRFGAPAQRALAALLLALAAQGVLAQADPVSSRWCQQALWDELDAQERSARARHEADPQARLEPLYALALSGGGYRAMLFHVGTLHRLNDVGLLGRLSLVSSVSGGSITAAYLAHRWNELQWDQAGRAVNLNLVEEGLRSLATETMDVSSILRGLLPFSSASREQVRKFDRFLFAHARLADIQPSQGASDGKPRRPTFVFNATNLKTGELFQFRGLALGGPLTGWSDPGDVLLSEVVAASSSFPPFLSPTIVKTGFRPAAHWHACNTEQETHPHGIDDRNEPARVIRDDEQAAFRDELSLIDGGVADNLGLHAIDEIHRVRKKKTDAGGARIAVRPTVTFVSDGGKTYELQSHPATNWLGQLQRIIEFATEVPDRLRVARIVWDGYERTRSFRESNAGDTAADLRDAETRNGKAANATLLDEYAFWSIRRKPKIHDKAFDAPSPSSEWLAAEIEELSNIPTRLQALGDSEQKRLVNWGYLAAHHGLPYIGHFWSDRWKYLDTCRLPHDPASIPPAAYRQLRWQSRVPEAEDVDYRAARCTGLKRPAAPPARPD